MSTVPPHFGPLVSAGWLRARMDDPSLVLLDARIARQQQPDGSRRYVAGREQYETDGHIPGARFADLISELSDPGSGLHFTLPDEATLELALRRLGIGRESSVVAYDDDTGVWAARVWWLLRSVGHERVGVLNGGLGAWIDGGGTLEHGPSPAVAPGDLVATFQTGYFTAHERVVALSGSSGSLASSDSSEPQTLLCALDHAVFTGERPSGAARNGHIPGSLSFPYSALLDDSGLIDPGRVDPALAGAGVDPDARLVTYCGGGINACGVALALAAAGHTNVSVYDGSLQQWAADEALEMGVDRYERRA